MTAHPTVINGLLKGQIDANDYINGQHRAGRDRGQRGAGGDQRQEPEARHRSPPSFDQITFTNDPIASSLVTDASHAVKVGLLKPVTNLTGIYDLGPLNKLLAAAGQPQVSS